MREHIQIHIAKYFPEEEPVVLEEIVIGEEEVLPTGDDEEVDGTAHYYSLLLSTRLRYETSQ